MVGETLYSDCQTHRIKVVTAFLMPVIPLNKLDCLRELLEENSACLAGCRTLLPFHVLCGLRHGVGATLLGGRFSHLHCNKTCTWCQYLVLHN